MQQVRGGYGMLSQHELKLMQDRWLWLSCRMIHDANHLRHRTDALKVVGHQASCALMGTILTALYGHALRPQDRVAINPHAGPVFHALRCQAGNQTLENTRIFRGYGGVQSYPSRTKDGADVDFSSSASPK